MLARWDNRRGTTQTPEALAHAGATRRLCRRSLLGTVALLALTLRAGGGETPAVARESGETPAAREGAETAKKERTLTPPQEVLLRTVECKRFDASPGIEKLVALPTGPGNAADYYAKLETFYPQDRVSPQKIEVRPDAKGLDEIVKGAAIRTCSLCPDYYPLMETGTDRQPDLLVHNAYLFALLQRAQNLEDAGDLEGAARLYQSGLIWGWHFAEDRPHLLTFLIGLSIQARTARQYARFLQRRMEMAKSQDAHDFCEAVLRVRERVHVKARMHLGDFTHFNCLHALVKVAKEDEDACWRQEAVLRLGVLRHGAPEADLKDIVKDPENQRIAESALTHVAEHDPKPWIRKLALWSIATVTPERFAEMRALDKFIPEEHQD